MKKNFLALGIILTSLFVVQTLSAQTNSEEVDFYQSIFGAEKKALVADFLKLEESNPFWPVYDEYETKRKALGKDRLNALEDYFENYDKMDDVKADEVIKHFRELRKGHDKLLDSYYKKVKKSSGSKVAAQFFQLEAYFLSEIRAGVLEGIPFIGEFDN